jgi:hypothetical protein
MAWPLIIAAAAVGGSAGLGGAIQQNQRIKGALGENYKALNDKALQEHLQTLDQEQQLNQSAVESQGALFNSLQGKTGLGYRLLGSSIAREAGFDQANLNQNSAYQDSAIAAQKQSFYRQAQSQMKDPIAATVMGALQGASAGASLGSAISAASSASAASNIAQNGSAAQKYALANGVAPEIVNNPQYRDTFENAYSTNNQLRDLGIKTSQNQFEFSQLQLDYARRRYR